MFLFPDGFVVVSGTGPVEACAIPAGFSPFPVWTDDSLFRKWNVSLRAGQSPCAGAKTRFPAENAKIPGLFPALNFQRTLLLLLADSAKIQQRSDWRGKCPIGKCPAIVSFRFRCLSSSTSHHLAIASFLSLPSSLSGWYTMCAFVNAHATKRTGWSFPRLNPSGRERACTLSSAAQKNLFTNVRWFPRATAVVLSHTRIVWRWAFALGIPCRQPQACCAWSRRRSGRCSRG